MESIGAVKHLAKITNNLEKRIENLENHHNNGLFDKIKILQFMIILMVFFTALWYWKWMVSDSSARILSNFRIFSPLQRGYRVEISILPFLLFLFIRFVQNCIDNSTQTRERAKDSINARWIQIGSSVWCVVQLTELKFIAAALSISLPLPPKDSL